jgi:hypothetical protein
MDSNPRTVINAGKQIMENVVLKGLQGNYTLEQSSLIEDIEDQPDGFIYRFAGYAQCNTNSDRLHIAARIPFRRIKEDYLMPQSFTGLVGQVDIDFTPRPIVRDGKIVGWEV